MNNYISKNIANTVKMIAAVHPNVVFCGSFGLVYNGLLKREVKDLDILTEKDYYKTHATEFFFEDRSIKESNSEKFCVGNVEIKCFTVKINGVKVDVLHNSELIPEYDVVNFDGIKIRVEKPEGAIEAKKRYVLTDTIQFGILKHLKDLILLDVNREELVDIIDESHLYDEIDRRKLR